jgi:2-polyprenyl-3-methyl-5-hydroxy-6-metoxy-1,4-benzoquinol methylase
MNARSLQEFRYRSALASGGISSFPIKKKILEVLDREAARGRAADVGAGQGELLTILMQNKGLTRLEGLDIMPRPLGLPEDIGWTDVDLNEELDIPRRFDVVICSENIEHLENPRRTFRNLRRILVPGGLLVLTMPNQESLRSYVSLILDGHFAGFRGDSYPAHITALLRLDLLRIASESGFSKGRFDYVNTGGIPGAPRLTWQRLSLGLLRGRLFSDNIVFIARAAT